MAVYKDEPRLSPGKGFFLGPDGRWNVKDIPSKVVEEAEFSGYLTIQGYNCMVFEMPDKSMWAQKSTNTPAKDESKLSATKPSDISRSLRNIASAIEASDRPIKNVVMRDLQNIVNRLTFRD